MYIIPIAWLYVALMMAVAEASNSNGTVLGGLITFVLYGLAPVILVVYLMASPARRRAIQARDVASAASDGLAATPATSSTLLVQPDASGHAPAAPQGDAVAPMRKEA